jgi:hypothetical protein
MFKHSAHSPSSLEYLIDHFVSSTVTTVALKTDQVVIRKMERKIAVTLADEEE